MSGIEQFNYPRFREVEASLVDAGFEVISPAVGEPPLPGSADEQPHAFYLRRGIAQLLECDAVALLEGWGQSEGAKLEVAVARGLGMQRNFHDVWVHYAKKHSRVDGPPVLT